MALLAPPPPNKGLHIQGVFYPYTIIYRVLISACAREILREDSAKRKIKKNKPTISQGIFSNEKAKLHIEHAFSKLR